MHKDVPWPLSPPSGKSRTSRGDGKGAGGSKARRASRNQGRRGKTGSGVGGGHASERAPGAMEGEGGQREGSMAFSQTTVAHRETYTHTQVNQTQRSQHAYTHKATDPLRHSNKQTNKEQAKLNE